MGLFNSALVYCSKDKEDWEKAKKILDNAAVSYKAWISEELPVGGCGCKIDIRKDSRDKVIPKDIYKIEVTRKNLNIVEPLLKGKVKDVQSYGI